jgi:hypothetical protein
MGKKRFTKRLKWFFVITALTVTSVLLFSFFRVWYRVDHNAILTKAMLSALPKSIKNFKVETRYPSFNQRWLFMRFQAEPNDISRFISSSAGIDASLSRPISTASDSKDNPDWWSVDRSASGLIYSLTGQRNIIGGTVVYDDADTVHIFILFEVQEQMRVNTVEEFIEDVWHEVKDVLGH